MADVVTVGSLLPGYHRVSGAHVAMGEEIVTAIKMRCPNALGRCETCTHWSRAGRVIIDDGTGECARGWGSAGGPRDAGTLAYASDWEGWQAVIVTKPNFGCVMYEARC